MLPVIRRGKKKPPNRILARIIVQTTLRMRRADARIIGAGVRPVRFVAAK